jgi:FKBP-type peptidyl-prolyl cis-trans isomerase FklB
MKTIPHAVIVLSLLTAAWSAVADDRPMPAAAAPASAAASAARAASAPGPVPATAAEKIGYAIAFELVRDLKKIGLGFDIPSALRGMQDADRGVQALSDEEMKQIRIGFQAEAQRKRKADRRMTVIDQGQKAEDFLKENATKPGVVSLPSGVQYRVVEAGTGAKPQMSDLVEVQFSASLLDGRVFDHSTDGKPYNLKLSALVPGWRQALSLMPVGSHWQIWVPPAQGYGDRGFGKLVGPAELLFYDVKLISAHP